MNAPAQQTVTPISNQPISGITFIAGRIRSKRRISTQAGNLHLTFVTLPAPDEYSSPATVELRSTTPLGEVGDDIRVKARIGGRVRAYDKTDRETGEVSKSQLCNMDLTVIEA